jgi:CheY-like chemotaxis protein
LAKVLLIDDEPADRLSIASMLRDMGHEVVTAHDGETGVFRYQTIAPDVVVTDLVMPNLHGVLVIAHLRDVYPDARVIAVSGKDANGLRRADEAGAAATLTKPVDRHALSAAMGEALAGPYESPWVE